jgi:3-hydroxyisobutyrate dehydrogenase
MRPSLRLLNASITKANPARLSSTSFIGLGRMGAEMAYNLFSKQLVQFPQARFVVCDAFPEATEAFCKRMTSALPGIQIKAVSSPEMLVPQ